MNIIDIIILVILVVSAIMGFASGAIRQLGSLVGIIAAIILAKSFGYEVGTMLGINSNSAYIWGYIIVLVISFMAVAAVAVVLHKIVSAVGLGIINRLLGAAFSVVKWGMLLSIALIIFNATNNATQLVDKKLLNSSLLYRETISMSRYILPTIEWVEDQIPTK